MYIAILMLFLVQPPAEASSSAPEPPEVVAQRAAAVGLEAQGMFREAGDAYVRLAEMPGVNQRGELDKAHTNYDSAYMASKHPSRLCWALAVAERVIREGEFNDEDQASYWRDNVDDDLRRLQMDARTTRRANCRFDDTGAPRGLVVATLTDDDFIERPPTADGGNPSDRPRPSVPPTRRWRAQTATGAVFTGIGLGFVGVLAGVLELQSQRVSTMRQMSAAARAEERDFTEGEWREMYTLRDEARQLRTAAISVGVAGVISLSAGVALLATRKKASRKFAVRPYGGPLGGGATLQVRF